MKGSVATGKAGAGKVWPHLEINAFPNDDKTWRVDWFGGVEFVDRAARWSQPSIQVFLSKVVEQTPNINATFHANRKPSFSFSSNASAEAAGQISCWVTVGTLVILQVGDLWCNRRLVGHKDATVETFSQVCVDKPAADFIKAGFSGDGGFVLPWAEHPWHKGSTNSWCVHITLEDGRFLVVPCVELIRFYFGSSSSLLSQLFRLDLGREHLYDVNETNVWPSRKLSWLELAPDMPRRSAADIARIAGDGAAWKAALTIGRSCAAAEMHQRFPKMGFPFGGLTNLVVEGEWLTYGGKPKQTFIVQRLLSCSHPFPFSKLHYKEHESAAKPGARSSEINGGSRSGGFRGGPAQAGVVNLVERDAGNFSARPISFMKERLQRFTDLDNKSITRQKSLETSAGSPARGVREPIADGSMGLPGAADRIRPVELLAWADDQDQAPRCLVPLIQTLDEAHVLFQVIYDCEDRFWRHCVREMRAQTDSLSAMLMPIAEDQWGHYD